MFNNPLSIVDPTGMDGDSTNTQRQTSQQTNNGNNSQQSTNSTAQNTSTTQGNATQATQTNQASISPAAPVVQVAIISQRLTALVEGVTAAAAVTTSVFVRGLSVVSFGLLLTGDTPQSQLNQANQVNPDKPIGEQIQAKLKRVKDYPSELENQTPRELEKLAHQGGELGKKAKKLLKLGKEGKRLDEKTSGKPR